MTNILKKATFGLWIFLLIMMIAATIIEKLYGTTVSSTYFYGSPFFIGLWIATTLLSLLYIISRHNVEGRVVVIDCVTLWATNFFFDNGSDVELSLRQLKEEFDKFTRQAATFIFVTNEIGMGGTSEHPAQRRFTDLQGGINRYIAEKADRVVFLVSGCPLIVKDNINQG